jgi:hypothetical protein
MGRVLKPKTPNTPPNKGTQDECFLRKMAAHTVIQFMVERNRKIAKKSKLGTQESRLLRAGIHIPQNHADDLRGRRRVGKKNLAVGRPRLHDGEVVEPAHEAGAIFGVHGDNLHAHAFVGAGAADDGAGANFAFGGVKQQLNVRVQGERLLDTDEKPAQGEILDA